MSTDSSSTGTEHVRKSRKRKAYCPLTEFQVSALRKRYEKNPYIEGEEKESMSRNLGIDRISIEYWFKRRREVERKKAKDTR